MGRHDGQIAFCHEQIKWQRLNIRTYEDDIKRLELANEGIKSKIDLVSGQKSSVIDMNNQSTDDFRGNRRDDFDQKVSKISDAIASWLTDTEMNRKSIRFKIAEYREKIEVCQTKINSLYSQIEYYHRLNREDY